MLITSVFAETQSTQPKNSIFTSLAPILIIAVIFYFLVIRPQQKKIKKHQTMIDRLKKGDRVVTSGGIIAIVHKIETEKSIIVVEIAANIRVKIEMDSISKAIDSKSNTKIINE